MMSYLRISASTLIFFAFVLAPVLTIATADYAYAKNGSGGGNSHGGGEKSAKKSGSEKGHDKASKSRNASGGNGNKSKSGKGFGRALKDNFESLSRDVKQNGIGGLFKQNKEVNVARSVSPKSTRNAPNNSTRPMTRPSFKDRDYMHPSNLGKMNGMINSSPNAKLLNIANGQYLKDTGPVSSGAALAVADYQFLLTARAYAEVYSVPVEDAVEDARTTLELQAAYGFVDEHAKRPAEEQLTRQSAEAIVTDPDADLESSAYKDAEAFLDAQDFVDQAEAKLDEGVDARPDAGKVAAANDVIDADVAVTAAELNSLTTYKADLAS
jgi:hypothetical protein